MLIGISAAILTVFFAISLSLSYKNSKFLRPLISLSSSGYAVPGSVISAGLLVGFDYLFNISITLAFTFLFSTIFLYLKSLSNSFENSFCAGFLSINVCSDDILII